MKFGGSIDAYFEQKEMVRAQLEKDEQMEGFKQHLRQNKALDFVYRNANISEG